MTELAGRTCVVTGASSGIGRALAVAFASQGADVWAVGRNRDRLDTLQNEVAVSGGRVTPLVRDLARDEDLESVGDEILAGGDRVHVLVHGAGEIALGAFGSCSADDLDRQYRVNLRAPVVLTQALLPALTRAGGQVVFINSSAALRAAPQNVLYAATKHGLKAVADGLRDAVNSTGVRVTTVYAGRTATPMQAYVHEVEGKPYRPELLLRPDDVVDVVLAALHAPPSAEVTDIYVRPMRKADGS